MFFLLKHRQVLLEIFSKNYRVRRNLIQSRLTQECGEDLSKQEVDKVLKVRRCLRRPELGVGGRPAWGGARAVRKARSAAFLPPAGGGRHVQRPHRARRRLRLRTGSV